MRSINGHLSYINTHIWECLKFIDILIVISNDNLNMVFLGWLLSRSRFTVKLMKHESSDSPFVWALSKRLSLILFLKFSKLDEYNIIQTLQVSKVTWNYNIQNKEKIESIYFIIKWKRQLLIADLSFSLSFFLILSLWTLVFARLRNVEKGIYSDSISII